MLLGRIALGLTGLASLVLAERVSNSAEIRTVPEIPVWVADGQTRYKVNVWVDNTELNDDPTDGVQWRLSNNPALSFISGSNQAPPLPSDFFGGRPMMDDWISPPGSLSSRLIEQVGGGPVSTNGFVGEYEFIVSQSGTYHIDLADTGFVSGTTGNPQSHTVSYEPITVVPPCQADLNRDGYVNCGDYAIFQANMGGPGVAPLEGEVNTDFDGDGDTDSGDYASFQTCFTGDQPVTDPDCHLR